MLRPRGVQDGGVSQVWEEEIGERLGGVPRPPVAHEEVEGAPFGGVGEALEGGARPGVHPLVPV
jgi:hypothetical protein